MSICNLEYIKSITPGSHSFSIKIIETFLTDTPIKVEELKTAILEEKWQLTYEIAHKIKPGVLMLGLPSDNSDALLKIMKFAKDDLKQNQIKSLFNSFIKNIDLIYKDLENSLVELKKLCN